MGRRPTVPLANVVDPFDVRAVRARTENTAHGRIGLPVRIREQSPHYVVCC